MSTPWAPDSWKQKPEAQHIVYDDDAALADAVRELASMPPLVTSWEVERLKNFIGDAQEGKRFLLQGGDCAETLADCTSSVITNKLKILLQMSLVLVHGAKIPVIRVGRLAGQYAKPRSNPFEEKDGVKLPSYFGDLVNRAEFDKDARRADPRALIRGYTRAALTLNFVRSLSAGGFADLHHPEYWDLAFLSRADLPAHLRRDYTLMSRELSGALKFMEALGETSVADLTRVEFFTSHEGLNLHYESAQTRKVPRREGHYDLTTHLPWIGDRTRDIKGAHVEFFRGIENTVGVKIGPSSNPKDVVELLAYLNPKNERGKIVLIARMGASRVKDALPPLAAAVKESGAKVLWVTDPMHGNTISLSSGIKTRNFEDILAEIERSFEAHAKVGTRLGGVHFELTGDDVTECIGGGISESDLDKNYASVCDPRLNYRQALEMAFLVARGMAR